MDSMELIEDSEFGERCCIRLAERLDTMIKSLLNSISSAMGLKDSKVFCISYEEACRRVSDSEYTRLNEAFKRVAVSNSFITKANFFKDVLGDLFPQRIAELIYVTSGGTAKGIFFKELLSALVVLTKGTQREKIKFLFGIYSCENNLIVRDEFLKFVREIENISSPDNFDRLFLNGINADLEQFSKWVLVEPNATSLTSWLLSSPPPPIIGSSGSNSFNLSNDHETPTFYQTLAGVTHLEEEDILELEKRYWNLHPPSRKVDKTTLMNLVSPPLPETILQGFLDAFDENRDGHIDFKEMACGISAAARGPAIERQKFCFKIFDEDKDGFLSISELKEMVAVMKCVLRENLPESPKDDIVNILLRNDGDLVEEIINNAAEGVLSLEEYLVWSLTNPLPEQFLLLIYQVCQVVLGLKPLDPAEEYETVISWLSREEKRGIQPGQVWYLVSMDWWSTWVNYSSSSSTIIMSKSDSGVCSNAESMGSQTNFLSHVADNMNGKSGNLKSWTSKKSVEASVAMDVSHNVVVTGISAISENMSTTQSSTDCDSETAFGLNFQANSSSSSTIDSTRSNNSASPSPMNSPSSIRRNLNGSLGGNSLLGKRRKPGGIDNSNLLAPLPSNTQNVPVLTGEGGRLRTDLKEGTDFKVIPQPLWEALNQWYGSHTPLPRQVIDNEKTRELEYHPLTLLLYRHQAPAPGSKGPVANSAPWTTGPHGIYGANALNTTISYVQNHNLSPPKKYLASTASFSRKSMLGNVWTFICGKLRLSMSDTRLMLLTADDLTIMIVLEEEEQTLEQLGIKDKSKILIEVRNSDQTWPEEIGSLTNASSSGDAGRNNQSNLVVEKGLTGLNNLGNTCFMNSALQCVSNTRPLTLYFLKKMHMYELNRNNFFGMKGHIAKRYGDLVTDIWSGTAKTIAPFKLRFTIGKYESRFAGFQQHDAQELLAFLLDGLHEDLNRVAEKPYEELKDSNNRPDVICAQEAWENHLLRNKSIVVDLFHGQLKSSVRCKECQHESVRFDPFNYLTLPLAMESYVFCDFIVIRQDGSKPIRYGILGFVDERYEDVKSRLSDLTASEGERIEPENLIVTDIRHARVIQIYEDSFPIKNFPNRSLYVYEMSGGNRGKFETVPQIQRILSSSKNHGGLNKTEDESHSRQSSFSSSGSNGQSSQLNSLTDITSRTENIFIVVHRKMIPQETYFLAALKTRPVLFGLPLVLPYFDGMSHLELYKRVWALVARLVSPLPPTEGPNIYNHAQDCDDSLGYEYPFVLRVVLKENEMQCGRCQWGSFCRGCPILCNEASLLERPSSQISIVIDWDPTALHLRYQLTQEMDYIEHRSVGDALTKQSKSVSLKSCLDAFTKEEELSEAEKYFCSKCGRHQLATKKLQIWRLPPILCVNLKRFQFLQGKWVKSHKVVDFPFTDFNPTPYLADIPRLTAEISTGSLMDADLEKSLYPLQDFHQHRLQTNVDPFLLNYKLYAVVCHSGGMLASGHYIAYAKAEDGRWHCFNDSSCKEVPQEHLDSNSAYMLFYERCGIDAESYLPRIDPSAVPIITDEELEAEENDLKRLYIEELGSSDEEFARNYQQAIQNSLAYETGDVHDGEDS